MSAAQSTAVAIQPTSLTDVTRDWFLFLTTYRRQVRSMPAEIEWVRGRLEDLLGEMERRAAADPRLLSRYQEARYPLVYFADEVLLSCQWMGEAAWARDLLETRVFNTQHGGQDFYDRLERAMAGDDVELLEVYYKCLVLGFRGRMIKKNLELAELRRNVYRRLPAERITGARFCPEAYESVDDRDFAKLPAAASARVVIILIAFIAVVWIVMTGSVKSTFAELNDVARGYVDPASVTEEG